MTTNCDPLFDIREGYVQKMTEAIAARDALAHDVERAMIALAGAEAMAATCLLLGPTPAAAACGVGVGIAIGTAYYVLQSYQEQLEEAEATIDKIQGDLDFVDGLLSHCQALEPWQDEAAGELLGQAPDPGSVEIPEVDDGAIDEAEQLVASLEAPAYDDAYA